MEMGIDKKSAVCMSRPVANGHLTALEIVNATGACMIDLPGPVANRQGYDAGRLHAADLLKTKASTQDGRWIASGR